MMKPSEAKAGARIRLSADVDRFPILIVPAGATGTILCADANLVRVQMDAKHPDLDNDDFGNCLEFYGAEMLGDGEDAIANLIEAAPAALPFGIFATRGAGSIFGAAANFCKTMDGQLERFATMEAAAAQARKYNAALRSANVSYRAARIA